MTILMERWMDKVLVGDDCWLWQGSRLPSGYGTLRMPGLNRPLYAHRVSHELFKGPIPPGFDIDHLCRVKACVHPDHLEAVTRSQNLRRVEGTDTHCKAGHLREGNTYVWHNLSYCKACHLESEHARAH